MRSGDATTWGLLAGLLALLAEGIAFGACALGRPDAGGSTARDRASEAPLPRSSKLIRRPSAAMRR
ncbi:MAG TPA: hypothetical protein VGB52_00455 [Actinomycetota bacterium]